MHLHEEIGRPAHPQDGGDRPAWLQRDGPGSQHDVDGDEDHDEDARAHENERRVGGGDGGEDAGGEEGRDESGPKMHD